MLLAVNLVYRSRHAEALSENPLDISDAFSSSYKYLLQQESNQPPSAFLLEQLLKWRKGTNCWSGNRWKKSPSVSYAVKYIAHTLCWWNSSWQKNNWKEGAPISTTGPNLSCTLGSSNNFPPLERVVIVLIAKVGEEGTKESRLHPLGSSHQKTRLLCVCHTLRSSLTQMQKRGIYY